MQEGIEHAGLLASEDPASPDATQPAQLTVDWHTDPRPQVHAQGACVPAGEALMTQEVIEHVAALIAEKGSDAWWGAPLEALLPASYHDRLDTLRRGDDTMDVYACPPSCPADLGACPDLGLRSVQASGQTVWSVCWSGRWPTSTVCWTPLCTWTPRMCPCLSACPPLGSSSVTSMICLRARPDAPWCRTIQDGGTCHCPSEAPRGARRWFDSGTSWASVLSAPVVALPRRLQHRRLAGAWTAQLAMVGLAMQLLQSAHPAAISPPPPSLARTPCAAQVV